MFRKLINILLLCMLACSGVFSAEKQPAPKMLSIVQLLASSERFDGDLVTVIGFLRIEHEGDALYLHKEDYENGIVANRLWIHPSEQMAKERNSLDLKYVRIVGTFRDEPRGSDLLRGGITDIRTCILWSDPRNPLRKRLDEAFGGRSKPR